MSGFRGFNRRNSSYDLRNIHFSHSETYVPSVQTPTARCKGPIHEPKDGNVTGSIPRDINSGHSCDLPNDVTPSVPGNNKTFVKVYLTVCTFAVFFSTGLLMDTVGTTLLHMGRILESSINSMAFCFTALGTGLFVGSVLCGLVYEKVDKELQFCLALLLQSSFFAVAPWSPNLYWYLACLSLVGTAAGYLIVAVQVYVLSIWVGSKWRNFNLYMMNAVYCVGAFVCPLIARNFLVELNPHTDVQFTLTEREPRNGSLAGQTEPVTVSVAVLQNFSGVGRAATPDGISLVRYSFVVTAAVLTLPLFMVIAAHFIIRHHKNTAASPVVQSETVAGHRGKKMSKRKLITLYILLGSFFFCEFAAESVWDGFLIAFTVDQLGFSIRSATNVKATYWIAFTLSNILIIPLSMAMRPVWVLTLDISMALLSVVTMNFLSYWNPYLMYISTASFGLFLGSVFAAGVLFVAEHLEFGGRASAVVTMGGSIGSLVGAPTTGFLYQRYSPMCVIYFLLGTLSLEFTLLIITALFVRVNLSHGTNYQTEVVSVGANPELSAGQDLGSRPNSLESDLKSQDVIQHTSRHDAR